MSIPLRLVPLYFCNIERINEYEKDTVFIIRSNNDKHSRNYGTGKSYRKRRSERQGGFPAGNDFPHRRAEHRLRQVFHRQQLSGSDIQGAKEQIPFSNVTFEPGCRNNWHIHHATKGGGQMLVCVAGKGWYQEWGKPAVQMLPGDVIHIPANVKHWHGAAADSWFAHLAFEVPGENTSNEWLEPVTDEEYNRLEE